MAAASAARQHALRRQLLRVDLPRRRLLANDLIHQRLRGRGLVGLVVAMAAIAHQIDHDVLVEFHAIFEREARDEAHRLGIVGIHVQNRRLDHLRHVGAVQRRARIVRIAGGESHLVVDDDVHGAAGVEAARLRQLQRLHDDALAGKRGIAVNLHRQHLVALGIAAPLLARAGRAFDHGIDDFQMRGIERERHVHVARGRLQIGRKALVILDVARAAQLGEVVVPLELVEQILRRLAEQIDQHIEPAAMRHADDGLLDAGLARPAAPDRRAAGSDCRRLPARSASDPRTWCADSAPDLPRRSIARGCFSSPRR